jgi:phosphatidylethanolamine-binding protein (PEBP) family uncharacterized protein
MPAASIGLDVDKLCIKERAKCKDIEATAQSHVLAAAEFIGTYSR